MRRLALLLALAAAPLGAQPMPPHVAEIARILQTGGLLPPDLAEVQAYGAAQSRADLLGMVAMWVAPGRGDAGAPSGFVFYTGDEGRDTLRVFVDDLRASGVISARTERRLRQRLEGGGLRLALAQLAAQLTATEDRYQPGPLAPGLDALVAAGVLTPRERAAVDSLLERDRIESGAELAAALPSGVLVRDPQPGEPPEAFYRRAITAVLSVLRQRPLADLALGAVEARVVSEPDVSGTVTNHDLLVRAEIGGRRHAIRTFLDFTHEGETPDLSAVRADGAAALVNKALRDADVPHRVFAVAMDPAAREWAETTGTALVALPPEGVAVATSQDVALGMRPVVSEALPFALASGDGAPPADTLSTERMEALLGRFREAGLLDGLPAERIAALETRYLASVEGVLDALGLLLFVDAEMSNVDTPYTSLVADLAAASGGRFAPEAVRGTFDWERETADLAFTLGGTRYAADLAFRGDWLDSAALQLIDRALREASGARLYTVVEGVFESGFVSAGERFMVLTEPQRAIVGDWLDLTPYTEWATAPAYPDEE